MKNVYFGYGLKKIPKVGETTILTKVYYPATYCAMSLKEEQIVIGPVQVIEKIANNMSILWTEKTGYAVYYTEK